MTPAQRERLRKKAEEERTERRNKRYAAAQKAREERTNPPLTLHQLRRKSEEKEQEFEQKVKKEREQFDKAEAVRASDAEAAEDARLQSQVNEIYDDCVKERLNEGLKIERALEICKKAYSPNVLGIASETAGRKTREALAAATRAAECLRGYGYNALTKTCEKISSAIDYARYGDGEHDSVRGALEALQHGINWENVRGGRTRRKRRRSKRKTKRKTIRKRNKRRRKTRKRRKVKRKRRRKSRR